MLYDCFPFFNELDLLEIRLNTLDSIVDKFVLVEAAWTHAGNPKPLFFNEAKNESRFVRFRNKIIHVIVEDQIDWKGHTWNLENYQRNSIIRGLTNCKPDDVIMISDVDEIPFPEKVLEIMNEPGIKSIIPYYCAYYLNMLAFGYRMKLGINIIFYRDFLHILDNDHASYAENDFNSGTNATRIRGYFGPLKKMYNFYGWHFSYLGGVKKVLEKMQSYAHQERNVNLSEEAIAQRIDRGILFENESCKLIPCTVGQKFPAYVLDNQERFSSLIYPRARISDRILFARHVRNYFLKRRIKEGIWLLLKLLAFAFRPCFSFYSCVQKRLYKLSAQWEIRDFD